MSNKKYLFICGCPRSGTTALWNLVASHKDCVIGVERYGNRFFDKGFLSKNHFEKTRFFDNQPGDTFYPDLANFNNYYIEAEKRFDEAAIVGDKIPLLFNYYNRLHESFPKATVLMIFRNIFDVAASYSHRASDESDATWNDDKGVASAISDWASAIKAYRNWKDRMRIIVIDYEKLFIDGQGGDTLFEAIGLAPTNETALKYKALLSRSVDLETRRARALSAHDVKMLAVRAPFGGYREVLKDAI